MGVLKASTSAYLNMRRRRLKIIKISAILILTAVIVVSGDLLWSMTVRWLDSMPWGRLQRIEVMGMDRLSRDMILTCANLPMGISLFHYPFELTAEKIEALPGIKKTHCFRRVPGRLIIKIVEREPIMAVALDRIFLMDRDGVRFEPLGTYEIVDVPFITSVRKKINRTELDMAIDLMVEIYEEHRTLYDHLSEIRTGMDGISIILRQGGAEVILNNELNKDHLELLDAFLSQKSSVLPPDLKYVDLRFGQMVIVGTRQKDV